MSDKQTYSVMDTLRHDGEEYSPEGENNTIALTAKQATPLLVLGVIAEILQQEGGSEGGKNEPPEDAEAKLVEIAAAINSLDKEDTTLWTKDGGKPQTGAIESITGWQVSAKERDAAWDSIKAKAAE